MRRRNAVTTQAALQPTEIWDNYYEETDPERRKKLLSDGCGDDPENDRNALRRSLWELRYTDPKAEGHRVDRLLWQFVNILCIYRTSGPNFLRKKGEKEIREAIKTMGFQEASSLGEEGNEELYREFRNTARRYFNACNGDKSYRKKYFGIVPINAAECSEKLARDAWRLSVGAEERFHLECELALLSRAVKDEFFAFEPEAQRLWDRCAAANHKDNPATVVDKS